MAPTSLTERLLSLHSQNLPAATTHPFLTQAGTGTLSSTPLCEWLVQDKYYQFGYVNFIGRLISKLDLTSYAFPKHGDENLAWKTFNVLVTALHAIKSEIDFYNETVDKYALSLEEAPPNRVTRQYVELFEDSSRGDKPLVWGLTVLWATEFCYLEAWSHAKKQNSSKSNSVQEGKGAIGALHKEFIPNWTSDDFKDAVDALAEVANLWADGSKKGEVEDCEKLWLRVLDLEANFWPNVE